MSINFKKATKSDFAEVVNEAKAEAYKYFCDLETLLIKLRYANNDDERRNIIANWAPEYKYITFK